MRRRGGGVPELPESAVELVDVDAAGTVAVEVAEHALPVLRMSFTSRTLRLRALRAYLDILPEPAELQKLNLANVAGASAHAPQGSQSSRCDPCPDSNQKMRSTKPIISDVQSCRFAVNTPRQVQPKGVINRVRLASIRERIAISARVRQEPARRSKMAGGSGPTQTPPSDCPLNRRTDSQSRTLTAPIRNTITHKDTHQELDSIKVHRCTPSTIHPIAQRWPLTRPVPVDQTSLQLLRGDRPGAIPVHGPVILPQPAAIVSECTMAFHVEKQRTAGPPRVEGLRGIRQCRRAR